MYKGKSYEDIMKDLLKDIPDTFDKREGSIIYDVLAPLAAELAEMYISLEHILSITYASTSYGIYLDKRVEEIGIFRKEAQKARRKGIFTSIDNQSFYMPIGTEFIIDDCIFIVDSLLEDSSAILIAKKAGEKENHVYGKLTPLEHIPNLKEAKITDLLSPGREEEKDRELYSRYKNYILDKPFAGNKAAYREEMSLLEGVGATKILRSYFGGGTLGICFLDNDFSLPSDHLIREVTNHFDPLINKNAITPLFHKVSVLVPTIKEIKLDISVLLQEDINIIEAKKIFLKIIKDIELEYRKEWQNTKGQILFISAIETALYQTGLLFDIDLKVNGKRENISLDNLEIPSFYEVNIYEQ